MVVGGRMLHSLLQLSESVQEKVPILRPKKFLGRGTGLDEQKFSV